MQKQNHQQYIFGLIINKYLLFGFGLIFIGFIFWYFSQILNFILIAWVFSMVGKPINNLFRKIKIGKFKFGPTISAAFTIITFFLFLLLFISLFVPLLVEQAKNLGKVDYQSIAFALSEPLNYINELADKYGLILNQKTPTEQVEQALANYFKPNTISNWFSNIISLAGSAIISFFSIVFITFFFLKESQLFTTTLQNLTPNRANDKISKVVSESSNMLTRYFGGILIQISIITLGLFIGLSVLQVPNALLIAFLASLFNVIPYVGPIIGGMLALFLTITSNLDLNFYNEMLPLLAKVTVVFAIMQMVDNFVLQPFIFSNRVYAHPLEIFIVVLIGAQIAGVTGMVIAIPTYTVIRIIAKNFLSEFDVIKNITKSLKESQ